VDAYSMRVRDVMVEQVVSVSEGQSLRDALDMMLDNGLTTLPVIDAQRHCIGVIAAVDMLPASEALDDGVRSLSRTSGQEQPYTADAVPALGLSQHAVADFMSSAVVTVGAGELLRDAAAMMLHNQIHHLIVVDDQEHVIGILSTMDILDAFAQAAQTQ
jgi:CBS domain-containing protein